MLPKKERADKKTLETVFKEGKFINSPHLSFRFLKTKTASTRISVIVPKSVSRLAAKRNHLRRAGYSAIKKQEEGRPRGITGAIIFKKYEENGQILENEIREIFNKMH